MKPWCVAVLLISFASINFVPNACAVAPAPVPQSTGETTSAAVETQPQDKPSKSLFDDPAQTQQYANLTVVVKVPQKLRAVDVTMIHPYPVKPPLIKGPAEPISTDEKYLKNLLLQSGYSSRMDPDKPYPVGGWRWQYIYQDSVRKSGLGVPHGLLTAYPWIARITPYAQREALHWNNIEAERFRRYEKALEEFDRTRADIENDAVRQGFFPIQLRSHRLGWTQSRIPAGSWWLTCTRKAPGIVYYWQIPLTAAPGENVNIALTQGNALVITGGW